MRRGWGALAAVGAMLLWGTPSAAHVEKRTDPCGCHHQWGLRHCHPKKKTQRCEAPVVSRDDKPHRHRKQAAPKRARPPAPEPDAQAAEL